MIQQNISTGSDINRALLYLKNQYSIEGFEQNGILVIPCNSVEEIYSMAEKVRRIFKECGYEKSWRIDPYYLENKRSSFDDYIGSQELHAI